jgi:GNAT superfamily N-acetyltransferase
MPLPRLRPMTTADIDETTAIILANDWGDRRSWFEHTIASPACRTFVAEAADGRIAGTGVATLNGPVAWIGTIWVAPEWRGKGLGRALTEAPIAAAETAGCRTLVLVATSAGRPLYERLGFELQTWYRTMEAPGLDGASPSLPGAHRVVRTWRPEDLGAMATLDAEVTGEDRRHLLAAFASPESSRVVVGPGDRLRGFVVRAAWGGGATIATDADDAMALLDARRRAAGPQKRVRAGVVASNLEGIARLEAAGWTEAWRAPRLIRGAPLEWRPDGIWGQFNHAVG